MLKSFHKLYVWKRCKRGEIKVFQSIFFILACDEKWYKKKVENKSNSKCLLLYFYFSVLFEFFIPRVEQDLYKNGGLYLNCHVIHARKIEQLLHRGIAYLQAGFRLQLIALRMESFLQHSSTSRSYTKRR